MRAAFHFGKKNRLRFVSHLDLQRYMQRALNRTLLPIAFSQGFNPHPVMNFASALAMGWESEYEILDVKLAEELDAAFALERMRSALPADLPVYACRRIEDTHASFPALTKMAEYIVTPLAHYTALASAVDAFCTLDSVSAVRKTKSGEREIDIRPLAYALKAEDGALYMRLALTEADTLKPDVLIGALSRIAGLDASAPCRILRTRLLGLDRAGDAKPLMEL